jgi:aryl carrier-like protein
VVNLYGPTEVTILATTYQLSEEDLQQERSIVGRPIAGSRVEIRTQDGWPAVSGVPGEIVISGAGVANGYYKRDQDTDTKFAYGPDGAEFRTGDLGRVRHDGAIEFLGRIDRQVKVRGFRVELTEIESALRKAGVRDCALDLVKFDGDNEARLVAYVLPSDGGLSERTLRETLKGALPAFMIPSVFVEISRIPTTISGKVDYAALSKHVRFGASDARGQTETERWLFTLVASILKNDKLEVTDNLLDLGLTSLDIVGLVSSIRGRNSVAEVGVLDIFEHPTIQALAKCLDSRVPAQQTANEQDGRAVKRQAMLSLRAPARAATALGANQ